jgi:transposase-like protein
MTKKIEYFDEDFKIQVIREVLLGQCTAEEARDKYNLANKSVLNSWIRLYRVYGRCSIFTSEEIPDMSSKTDSKDTPSGQSLKTELRLRDLERQLDEQRLLSEMYNRMIELAEKEYKIAIRKNFNTK